MSRATELTGTIGYWPLIIRFPDGLTTYEVAAVMAPHLTAPNRDAAEDALISLAASGGAQRRPFGNDALWTSTAAETAALAA